MCLKAMAKTIAILFFSFSLILACLSSDTDGINYCWEMDQNESLQDWEILRASEVTISSKGLHLKATENPTITSKINTY